MGEVRPPGIEDVGGGEGQEGGEGPPAPARALRRAQQHQSPSLRATNSSRRAWYCSGSSRIAAPVGQLRTQAGPPWISRQRSHLTATVRPASSRGSAPRSSKPRSPFIQSKSVRSVLGWTMKMLSYGQLRSQLPQPMQLLLI